jgi:ribosomal protein S18 acetylase RimI-like enzyme
MMMQTPPWSILEFTVDSCHEALSAPRVEVVGAFHGDVLAGFVALLAEGIEFEPLIVFLCADKEFRNQGVGTALLNHFEQRFKDAANLYLFVSDVNPDAQRLYQRQGYRQVGALPNFNLIGQTEFLYRKTRRALNT